MEHRCTCPELRAQGMMEQCPGCSTVRETRLGIVGVLKRPVPIMAEETAKMRELRERRDVTTDPHERRRLNNQLYNKRKELARTEAQQQRPDIPLGELAQLWDAYCYMKPLPKYGFWNADILLAFGVLFHHTYGYLPRRPDCFAVYCFPNIEVVEQHFGTLQQLQKAILAFVDLHPDATGKSTTLIRASITQHQQRLALYALYGAVPRVTLQRLYALPADILASLYRASQEAGLLPKEPSSHG